MSHDGDFSLKPFSTPGAPEPSGLARVGLHIERRAQALEFRFTVANADLLKWPGPVESTVSRRDELWKTTVFELFLTTETSSGYCEVNLAPSGDWNIYSFSGYREGMTKLDSVTSSPLRFSAIQSTPPSTPSTPSNETSREVAGSLDLGLFPFPLVGPVVFGATAVLEYLDGHKEYWALAHAGEKPDFHLRASFTGVLT